MKEFEQRVIDVMIYSNMIPQSGIFEIEECHLNYYMTIYGEIYGNGGKGLRRAQEIRFARKLAGRTLIRLQYERGAKLTDVKSGMLYLIANPAFPLHYKIGMTLDVMDRLAQYQTYDPYKKFEIVRYNFVLDRRHFEKILLNHPDIQNETGEWVLKQNADELFLKLTNVSS